ncbi:uncharacterized protein LOC110664185 isoform X3 [Hevea brasiliensis]|uniref:uncharacterized protein LOC110664185 isoform X3 n=1 Tax=Hevea brasiliensis TaxID=3981 RepID=UPI0025EB2171|nr:uncharacterized protein LOC110664185 isoform X3 [Hevea brasiliensis]
MRQVCHRREGGGIIMEEETSIKKRGGFADDCDLVASMFSWSLEDICNENLFEVKVIPKLFESVDHYFRSYVCPLLEETRARLHSSIEIIYRAPTAEVLALTPCRHDETLLYDVEIDYWRNRYNDRGKEPYKTLPGDVVILADAKPEDVSDLQREGRTWTLALVTQIPEDPEDETEDPSRDPEDETDDAGTDPEDETEDASTSTTSFKIKPSKDIEINAEMQKSLVVIFLTNITTNRRIWNRLHKFRNLDVIKEVADSMVQENCSLCSMHSGGAWHESVVRNLSSTLNESQTKAILTCLRKIQCNHSCAVELIWGPPGTGKTKTVSMLLFTLLRMKRRILICAPTNVAIKEVASRVRKLVIESSEIGSGTDALFCSLSDILLFGNKDRLKVNSEIEDISLDYRVKRLRKCFAALTAKRSCFTSTIDFFEDCVCQYYNFLEKELIKEQERDQENENTEKNCSSEAVVCSGKHKSFLEFMREQFRFNILQLKRCAFTLCSHTPESYILKHDIQNMISLVGLLGSFETLLFRDDVISEELEKLFSRPELAGDSFEVFADISLLLFSQRSKCLSILKNLRTSLSGFDFKSSMSRRSMENFCFQNASLIFCTASSSYKLYSLKMEPMNLLVIDEAAQLKECESTIPLQLPGIRHAILIGDECQLPATVESNLSDEAGFGRSLFERLSSLGHPKHLLNMQYRMHPSISTFPNKNFYSNLIIDAPNVRSKSYEKHYLPGSMFGPYSFINVTGGREEVDDVGHSWRNMVEVAIVLKLVHCLYKEWSGSKQNINIGVISPYAAQVVAIQEKLGHKYKKVNGFSVKVQSIDGFQGGEEDVVIISTVRSNSDGFIGFMSNRQRINVSLTRARHCLWILGNERTLARSGSVWEELVSNAKQRQCFFNADENKELAKAILEVKKEFDQLDDLLNGNSPLFKCARWKVLFSENFRKSFSKLTSVRTKKFVLNLLLRLSSGWRPKKKNVDSVCEKSSQILKQFKVEGLYVLCSIDIVKEEVKYIQVLKVWDVLPLEDIPRFVKCLDGIFERQTDDFISRCNEKSLKGNLEAPKNWSTSFEIVRYKNLSNSESRSDSNFGASDATCYVENCKVSESLLLMKFYSLSSGIVKHLLSDHDGREIELPFEVTVEERDMIAFQRSMFILGRSGTGKTTVLTMKLFQKEQQSRMATEGIGEGIGNTSKDACCRNNVENDVKKVEDSVGEAKKIALRQLFVTVNPKLCYAIKHHISHLKSFASGGKYLVESSSVGIEDIDEIAQFEDAPYSFVDIPSSSYPLIISFYKFLMMLDGTIGNSYFERFPDVRQILHAEKRNLKSISIQTFITTREVNYDKFCSIYWPHFNTHITKMLDSSIAFTEIMSHIKCGLQSGEFSDGRLARKDYVTLSEVRLSTLSREKREMIYDIYEDYEKMKIAYGDFDMADFVIDLHLRLKNVKYEGDIMDFVYIDEVQDLTMRQIALFKYICRNVSEGFVFSGDTAQTIARGIDFRFEEIRNLFYNEFLLGSSSEGYDGRKEKGRISKIFHLSQNFRTHAGILKLAQSVIDLLYRFFPSFVDILSPETSLIFGEAPIWLEARNDENAIVNIFGKNGNGQTNFVGFGAEQVILVRDDSARKEVYNYVGKQALVLTIMECKGLEFQDVLLYNFFGSSPLKNKWRVIYEYMKEQNLLDESFPTFNPAKHIVLCSELKQLYVAITRTRQRLWICENIEELSKPMFDYWKNKDLVQVRKLDDSFALAMQVASSPEEWTSRGYKLLNEGNYEMATMCFERAGDIYGEKVAKAAGLKATADRVHRSNPEKASITRRQAAEIYESIGKAEHAAECFYMLREYKRAGQNYLQCGESARERAGECFCLAGCYKLAAEVYARGFHFSEFLSACTKGELFDMGLQYIQCWKQEATANKYRSREMDKTEKEFLENCAFHYHKLNDNRAMMRYVRAFNSMDAIRTFLNALGCFDELLSLEEEFGNFLEAAKIAKLKGELLVEADLFGKAGHFKQSAMLILWYVFANSLWSSGSKGWPLKQFPQKEELLENAKSFAKNESNQFFELVCLEAEILLHDQSNLFIMKQHLNSSQRHNSIKGEILSARKILDAHFHLNSSEYVWENDLVLDLASFLDEKLSKNEVSIETLIYSWSFWKDKIVNIFECLGCLETQDVSEYGSYGEFCLNYLGVQRHFNNLSPTFVLINSDADWVREVDYRYIKRNGKRNGKLISLDVHHFVSASQNYWSSELISVGMKVLTNLESLYEFSIKNSFSLFCQSRSLAYIFEISKFLLNSKFLVRCHSDNKELQKFVGMSTRHFFSYIYPLDWRESLKRNMVSFRRTETCSNLLREMIFENVHLKNNLSYGKLGRIALIILGSGKLYNGLHAKIMDGLKWNSSWNDLIEDLCRNAAMENLAGNNIGPGELSLKRMLHGALIDAYNANWEKEEDYISPVCFLYLVERQLILLSCSQGYFLATKSSFVEWLIYKDGNGSQTSRLGEQAPQYTKIMLKAMVEIVHQFLYDKKGTMEWIRKCRENVKDAYAVVVLRLVVIICLLYLNFGICGNTLHDLLGRNYITEQLPRDFYDALWKRRKRNSFSVDVNVLAEAFNKMGNSLVIVSLGKNYSKNICPDAIFVDMKANQRMEDRLRELFPRIDEAAQDHTVAVELDTSSSREGIDPPDTCDQRKGSQLPSSIISLTTDGNTSIKEKCKGRLPLIPGQLWELLETLKSRTHGADERSLVVNDSTVKVGCNGPGPLRVYSRRKIKENAKGMAVELDDYGRN